MKSKTITVKLSPELGRNLERLSARLRKTKSVVVRLAIEELLRQPGAETKLSAFEVLSEFAGSLSGLDEDVSYNSKHLNAYGLSSDK